MLAEVNEAYHTTIVMITHNEGIAQMADRVVRIHDGQIISNLKQQKKKGLISVSSVTTLGDENEPIHK